VRRHSRGALRAAAAVLGLMAAPAFAQDRPDEHAAGRTVYERWCAPCHAAGVTHPGTHALMVKYQGVKSGVLLEWTDLPVDTVKFVVRHGISVMPQFRKTEISDQDLDALAQFLARNTPH